MSCIYLRKNSLFKQWKVRTIFETKCFSNLWKKLHNLTYCEWAEISFNYLQCVIYSGVHSRCKCSHIFTRVDDPMSIKKSPRYPHIMNMGWHECWRNSSRNSHKMQTTFILYSILSECVSSSRFQNQFEILLSSMETTLTCNRGGTGSIPAREAKIFQTAKNVATLLSRVVRCVTRHHLQSDHRLLSLQLKTS